MRRSRRCFRSGRTSRNCATPLASRGGRIEFIRACYTEAKKSRRWASNLRVLHPDEATETDGSARIADRDQLERAFGRLSIDHRAVVVLRHYLDLSEEAVADALGVPIGTVRSRLFYAMRALRAVLDADARPVVREAAQ